jgi:hypothetical protein
LFDDEIGPAKSRRPSVPNTLMFDEEFDGYAGQLENVLDAIRDLAPLASNYVDGTAAVGLIETARRSIEAGAEIDIGPECIACRRIRRDGGLQVRALSTSARKPSIASAPSNTPISISY